jgi:RNA polymerase sigma factor (sigma-70 family)
MANDEALAQGLLDEVGWVRGLARHLAGTHGDDVAQETWLLAARAQPDAERPLRPWLATVVRKLAHTRSRGDARRRVHEAAAAPEVQEAEADESASPESRLVKAELLHLIGELVARLDEPLRATVLMRYYEGLTSHEIAARLNIADGTVRWRLKQAVDELRRELDTRIDGGRRAWSLALAPAAFTKGALMVTFLKLGGTALLVALCGAVTIGALALAWRQVPGSVVAPAIGNGSRNVAALSIGNGSGNVAAPAADNSTAQSGTAAPRQDSPPSGDDLEAAQEAYVQGQYRDAIKLAEPFTGSQPRKAWRVIGAANCFLRDDAGAAAAWRQLDSQGRKFIEYVCGRNSVTLPDGRPVM